MITGSSKYEVELWNRMIRWFDNRCLTRRQTDWCMQTRHTFQEKITCLEGARILSPYADQVSRLTVRRHIVTVTPPPPPSSSVIVVLQTARWLCSSSLVHCCRQGFKQTMCGAEGWEGVGGAEEGVWGPPQTSLRINHRWRITLHDFYKNIRPLLRILPLKINKYRGKSVKCRVGGGGRRDWVYSNKTM